MAAFKNAYSPLGQDVCAALIVQSFTFFHGSCKCASLCLITLQYKPPFKLDGSHLIGVLFSRHFCDVLFYEQCE